MLTALSAIASDQADPMETTLQHTQKFLDYAATHRDAILTYRASNIVLTVHSDASYLSKTKARSQAGGHFFMSNNTKDPKNNGTALTYPQSSKQ